MANVLRVLAKRKPKTSFEVMDNQGNTKQVMNIDLANVKSPDPLAFAYGKFHGIQGIKINRNDKDLAPEYIRGYEEGRNQRKK